ncbi:hypothetical protein FRB95_010814 [Tulasnella sp. JGI-2019a]|nr:hypothetical protein FRB95_010814 [Tulasnella sp. JGI-2019a]
MFVGGLNWETTTETLKEYFSQFGKVDACTIMRDGAGRSRGFAFLTFEDAAAVNAVMVREHFLDGKVIDPKRAIPRLEHQRTQKIFVGGLAPSVTAETLKEYFSQHGSVVDATVMIDRESGRSKGFGFVTFEEGPPLDHLIGHGITLNNKVIEVKLAQPRHSGRNRDDDGGGGGGGGGGGDYRSGGANGGGGYNNHNNSHNNNGPPANAPPAFDAQAMANLYQRMMSVAQTGGFMGMGMGGMNPMMGGGGMGMGMGGGMNPMMGGMGRGMVPGAGGMMGGGGAGMMAPGPGMGRGGPMIPGGGAPGMGMGMGMGGGVGMGMGGAGGPPRGPRAGVAGGPQQVPPGVGGGPTAPGGGAAGPMRSHGMRGQNTYHPYGR